MFWRRGDDLPDFDTSNVCLNSYQLLVLCAMCGHLHLESNI